MRKWSSISSLYGGSKDIRGFPYIPTLFVFVLICELFPVPVPFPLAAAGPTVSIDFKVSATPAPPLCLVLPPPPMEWGPWKRSLVFAGTFPTVLMFSMLRAKRKASRSSSLWIYRGFWIIPSFAYSAVLKYLRYHKLIPLVCCLVNGKASTHYKFNF